MKKLFLVCVTACLLSGCIFRGGDAGTALFAKTRASGWTTDNVGTIRRQGKACATNILYLVTTGDSSIATAKQKAGISKIYSVDYDVINYLLGSTVCTIVSGE